MSKKDTSSLSASYDADGSILCMGMPVPWFLLCTGILVAASWLGVMPGDMIGGFAFCMALGFILSFIGDKIWIVREYFGGGALVALMVSAALVYYNLLPAPIVKMVGNFTNSPMNFLDWYIASLIAGSILSMDRDLVIKAGVRYFFPLVAGILGAYALGGLIGELLGFGWKQAILYVAAPIMGGGTGAGAIPMSQIYSKAMGVDTKNIMGMIYPAVVLGNILSIFGSAFLHKLGEKKPSLSGNGSIMRGFTYDPNRNDGTKDLVMDFGAGLLFACSLFIFGRVLGKFIPQIHPYALMIISLVVIKGLGLTPKRLEHAATRWYQFMVNNMTLALMVGVGVAMLSMKDLIAAMQNPAFFFVCFAVVVGAILGAGLVGMLVSFYFVESAISAGLCMANMGGTGDVACLSAAKRMNLMPFAQISSRLGGALILILQSFVVTWLM